MESEETSHPRVEVKPKEAHETTQKHERTWEGVYKLGAILLIVTAVTWNVLGRMSAALYPSGVPGDPVSYLKLVSQNQALAAATWSVWDVADLLLILPTVALYLALRHYNKTLALLGAVFQGLFIFFDISVTELNSLTLVSLSQGYASATTDTARAAYVTAAAYGYYALPLQTVLSFGLGTSGFFLWCFPMARSIFRRRTAFFGAIVNAIGVIGAFSPLYPSNFLLGVFFLITLPGVGLWAVIVGIQLYRHSRQFAFMDTEVTAVPAGKIEQSDSFVSFHRVLTHPEPPLTPVF